MKTSFVLSVVILLGAAVHSMAVSKPVRAVWAPRWFVASPEQIDKLVTASKESNINCIIFQVRGDGMLLYPSELEPRSDVLADQPSSFDPLGYAIEKAHAQGIEIHAWINSFSIWTQRRAPWEPNHIALKHPDWIMADHSGRRRASGDIGGLFADPGNPQVREHTLKIFMEVVRKYDVDGVHFDYIRYPGTEYCYCDNCLAKFRESLVSKLGQEEAELIGTFRHRLSAQILYPEQYNQWRRDQVTALVREVYRSVKAAKPKVQVTASTIVWGPFTPWQQTDAYRAVFQDWHGWMREGIIDAACPMIYTRNTQLLVDHLTDAIKDGGGTPVWAGIGCFINPPMSSIEQIEAAFNAGAEGVCIFAWGQMSNSEGTQEEVLKLLREGPFK